MGRHEFRPDSVQKKAQDFAPKKKGKDKPRLFIREVLRPPPWAPGSSRRATELEGFFFFFFAGTELEVDVPWTRLGRLRRALR